MMDKLKNIKRNFAIFILLIVITFYILLKDKNLSEIFGLLLDVKKEYILIAVICMVIFSLCEAINIGRTLKILKANRDFLKNLKYALVGFFFSSITPGASGGQPMQIYYMHKDKISISHSTLSVLIELFSSQIATIILSIIGITLNYNFLKTNLNGLIYIVYLGIILNFIIVVFLFIFIFSKKLSAYLINLLIKLLKFIKVRNIENIEEKLIEEINTYHKSAVYIKKHKIVMLKTFLTSLVQSIVSYSIPYWVYCSFGFAEYGIIDFITLQAVLYTTVSALPLPGAVGVSESAFLIIYKALFPATLLSSAMLLNRGISFYLSVLISGIIVSAITLKSKKINKDNIK